MPCRPAEDDPSLNPGHGFLAARLLLWLAEQIDRDPPIWAYDISRQTSSRDERPTRILCRWLGDLPEATRRRVLDGESAHAPQLREWWEKHRAADEARRS